MNKVDLKDDSEVAISPWRKGQPRKPIDQYDQSPKSPAGAGAKSPNASNTENMSPPNTDHKESTKIESSINQVQRWKWDFKYSDWQTQNNSNANVLNSQTRI